MARREALGDPAPRRILVRCPNWLGDLVMATPALRALRERFPGSELTLLLKSELTGVVAGSPWHDRVAPLRIYGNDRRSGSLRQAAASLRRVGYDLGVVFPNSFSSAWMLRLGGVSRTLGYARNGRRWLLTDPVPGPREQGIRAPVPMNRYYLDLVGHLGCRTDRSDLELHVTAAEEEEVAERMRGCGIEGATPLVAIAPGASFGTSKAWPADRYAQAADEFIARHGGAAWILPGPREEKVAREVAAKMRQRVEVLWPPIGVGPLKAAIRRSDLLLTNDAGARHVAAAFGVPHVVVMGPTDPRYSHTGSQHAIVVRREVPCGPCHLKRCPLDHRCMNLIEPKDVVEAAESLLAKIAPTVGMGRGEGHQPS